MIAHNMMKEKEKLLNINLEHKRLSFKMSIGNGDFALLPLYKLLRKVCGIILLLIILIKDLMPMEYISNILIQIK